MGMYDYISWERALPDYPLSTAQNLINFQTKDLPDYALSRYVVRLNGCLYLDDDLVDHTGAVDFYDSNVVSAWGGIVCTANGEDRHWLEYKAVFIHGQLAHVERSRYETSPAWPSKKIWGTGRDDYERLKKEFDEFVEKRSANEKKEG
jgi:hypothetical protein